MGSLCSTSQAPDMDHKILLCWFIVDGRLHGVGFDVGVDAIGDNNCGGVVGDSHHSSRPLYGEFAQR